MTLIRLHDIRENDVHESAGMSNIPWELEYGFQKSTDPCDDQIDILEELYWYQSSTDDESVLDGLSPDAPKRHGNTIIQEGTFTTRTTVVRNGVEVCVTVQREWLIEYANKLLRAAAVDLTVEVQREYLHPGPCVHVTYEVHDDTVSGVLIDDIVIPIRQLLDLRGFEVIGKMTHEEEDDC